MSAGGQPKQAKQPRLAKQPAGEHRVQYGTTAITFQLLYSDRETMAIHVYPDGHVEADAPLNTPLDVVKARVLKRAAWIGRQRETFQQAAPATVLPMQYVSGEALRYLGRQYRLKVVAGDVSRVLHSRGTITIEARDTGDKRHLADLLGGWYRAQARRVFHEQLAACYPRAAAVAGMADALPHLAIRQMKSRWGSCTAAGTITLNLKLIQVSKDLIDYVILHELCHLKEHNHSTAFYLLLDRVLPDWQERRKRLNAAEVR